MWYSLNSALLVALLSSFTSLASPYRVNDAELHSEIWLLKVALLTDSVIELKNMT